MELLWLLAQGRTATELPTVMSYCAAWIGQIAKRYSAEGPARLDNLRRATRAQSMQHHQLT